MDEDEDDKNKFLSKEKSDEITKELMKFLKMFETGEISLNGDDIVEFRDVKPPTDNVVYFDFKGKKK